MSENNEGGLADRGAGRTGGLSGSGQTGSNSNQQGRVQNFNTRSASQNALGRPYGITGFNVPRRDQTLQDRQFGRLGSGMVGTDFGNGTNNGNPSPGTIGQPPRVQTIRRRNPVTGIPEVIQVPVPPEPPPQPQPPSPPSPWDVPIHPKDMYLGQLGMGNYYSGPYGSGQYGPGVHPGYTGMKGLRNTEGPYGSGPPGPGSVQGKTGSTKDQSRLQFGGPAEPGKTYTVGENGPETLRMNRGGGGYVTPHNPRDRAVGLRRQFAKAAVTRNLGFP